MTSTGAALRMTIFVGTNDQFHHHPLYTEIVRRARARGLAGATVLRGCEGFGATSGRIHTTRLLSLSDDLPVVIMIVDLPDKVREFLPEVEELVTEGLIILDEVETARSIARPPRDPDGRASTAGPSGATGDGGVGAERSRFGRRPG